MSGMALVTTPSTVGQIVSHGTVVLSVRTERHAMGLVHAARGSAAGQALAVSADEHVRLDR